MRNTKLSQRDRYTLDTVGQTTKFLRENKNILIQNSDKGGKTVAMEKSHYESKKILILTDMCTYKLIKKDPTTRLQYKCNKLVMQLFDLKIINAMEKNKLINKTSVPHKIYGLPKIHKKGTHLRPICSFMNSPTYALSKYMATILKILTKEYNIKDAAEFKCRINNQYIDSEETLVSFDVISLFPSVPVNLAIRTIKEKWTTIKECTSIPLNPFIDILIIRIKESRYFLYKDKMYEQQKGMPMGSPISPVIADIVTENLLDEVTKNLTIKPRLLPNMLMTYLAS
ncbi:uncharacterized protein [Musca autumnalis]|uniref:uncharacterized protein n=1 Tax=Musca autumnalis TaxID=221902 RepID=UPI003CED93A2